MAAFGPAPFPFGDGFAHFNAPSSRGRPQFVWPRDGKNGSTWGRWKDIFTGKGPDIFVTARGQRPTRARWANRPTMDPFVPDDNVGAMPFIHRRDPYDFRRRRYRRDDKWTWIDARWDRNRLNRERNYPTAYRCRHGDWYQMYQHPHGFEIGADGHGPQFEHWHPEMMGGFGGVGLPPPIDHDSDFADMGTEFAPPFF